MTTGHLRLCASALAILAAGTTIAHAQDSASDTASEAPANGEIIVTAQKRAESVQSVPISIAAFSGASLDKQNVVTVLDLGKVATNFQTVRSSNTGSTRIGIRGVGSLANTLIEPSVAVFVDGVYVPRSGSVLGAFLDIEGVEVLRGPQGTLFGRNASVGALSLRSALPKGEFSGEVSGEIGSFDRYKISGNLNLPLTENVALRVAGMGQWFKGPWINKLDGKHYGGSDDVSFRGTLKADLGNVEWILRGDYTRLDGDGVANFDFDPNSVSAARLAFIKAAFNGGPDTNLNDRVMNQSMATGLIDENWGISSTASLELAGGSTLKLINSYRVWTNDQLDGDIVYFPVSLASRRSLFDSKSQNHELQFISPEKEWLGGKFDMVAGVYYFEEDFALGEQLNLGTAFCGVLVPAGPARTACGNYYAVNNGVAATDQDVFQNVKSFAAYGQGNLHLSDQLTLTLGGRWTTDRKRGTYAQASSPFTQTLRATEMLTFPGIRENRFTYRVSLNYKPSDDILVFANHSTGYKSGGYNSGGGTPSLSVVDGNGNLVSTKRLFTRETVKNYELGIKSAWLDRKVRANVTLYRMDIGGFQDRAFDGVSFIVRNAGNLRQQGVEVDLTIAPSRDFSVTGSVAYLDSQFTDFRTASNLPGLPGTQDLTGKPNTFSPKWSGNVAVDWGTDLGQSGMRLAVNGTMSFISSQFVGTVNDNNPQSLAAPYALLGGRISLSGADDRWTLSVFARNLANKHYRPLSVYQPLGGALGLNNTVFPGSTANRVSASEPRMFGAAATYRF
ncbi:TonB-dependent receptor [Novosphingobium sp. ERW19]|uniref:TonB-dependent receptor n=1 Tax=Novosphingobium TaxID=165696 RepID=UPI00145634A0|nr:TonB-dependent receptor [Novosphingobium sp. ERW19]NLR40546.1 TonB-dependent receptor [Novosphingobium sp. ERW19]